MSASQPRVLVVGAGIGGLAAASALRLAGCEVELVELKPEWALSGVGIIQPINALRALERLGVAQACLDAGCAYFSYRYMDAEGRVLDASPGPRLEGSELPSYNGIRRDTLHRILAARAHELGAGLRMGVSVAQQHDGDDAVEVVFSDGLAGRYDLMVGADGIYSATRQRLFGDAPAPQASGQSVWRVTMPRPGGMDYGVMMSGPGAKVGFIPIGPEEMYLLLVHAEDPQRQIPREALAGVLRERLAPFGGMVRDTLQHVHERADIVYRPLEVVRLPAPWHRGRTVLIGDAAHASTPHLGQGAAMAVEDAVVLGELMQQRLPMPEVMQQYQQRRHPRASFIQEASIAIGEYEQGRRPGMNLFQVLAEARACALQPI